MTRITREGAISELQACVDVWDKWMLPSTPSLDRYKEAVKMGLAALRGPTREQVEKMWRGEWKTLGAAKYGKPGVHYCTKCEECHPYKHNFCPDCGSPMTDEAVDIVMRRLEALKDG